ncbi:MAG: ATP-binding protein [Taibaiella sp.]|nr:ATP-binding protein [Taibaiella sp.]
MVKTFNIAVDFRHIKTHCDVVSVLSPAFYAKKNDIVYIHLNLNIQLPNFLYSDHLILVASSVVHLRSNGIKVIGSATVDSNKGCTQYASRVNFFKIINLNYKEGFRRWPNKGTFTEITQYDANSVNTVSSAIRKILITKSHVAIEVQRLLYYCLSEIMDNVVNHSNSPHIGKGSGWCCAQYFYSSQQIRLIICDTGVGIHNALTKNENSKFKNLSERESLERCTENGVTNGEGQGFGLFATSEFIKENKGQMIIYSGNHYTHIVENTKYTEAGEFWNGTFVFLKINTNVPVDYKKIMPVDHTLIDDYQFYIESEQEINDDLW